MGKRAQCALHAVVLMAALAGLAAPAQAGNGNGKDNGNGNGNGQPASAPTEQSSAPANSAEAPGQAKKDADVPPAPKQTAPDKKSSEAPAHQSAPSSGSAPGVKPSSSTAKNTNAPAGSNRTKLYGNGKTAGEIAMQHGYPASGNIHGPGNSQPHKVVTCGHRHEVDVHALKSHPAKDCGHSPTPPPSHHTDPPLSNDPHGVTPHGSPSTDVSTPATPSAKHQTGTSSGGEVAAVSGALAGTLAVGHTALPFTGFPLWAVAIAAFVLVGTGLSLRRLARATT